MSSSSSLSSLLSLGTHSLLLSCSYVWMCGSVCLIRWGRPVCISRWALTSSPLSASSPTSEFSSSVSCSSWPVYTQVTHTRMYSHTCIARTHSHKNSNPSDKHYLHCHCHFLHPRGSYIFEPSRHPTKTSSSTPRLSFYRRPLCQRLEEEQHSAS